MIPPTSRVCTQCNMEKPATEFLWKSYRKRLGARCRECRRANHKGNPFAAQRRSREYYAANRRAVLERLHDRRAKSPARELLKAAKKRAKEHNVAFGLTLADINVPALCPVLGVPIVVSRGRCSPTSPSLDRIDPTLGYVPGNVIVVSHRANTIKSDATVTELGRVYRFYGRLSARAIARRAAGSDLLEGGGA